MGTRVYVGNLPHSADTALVSDMFRPYGDPVEALLITNRVTGESKGFAFVNLDTAESAGRAIAELNGTMIGGQTLRPDEASERQSGARVRQFGGGRSTDARGKGPYSDRSDRSDHPRHDDGAHGSDQ